MNTPEFNEEEWLDLGKKLYDTSPYYYQATVNQKKVLVVRRGEYSGVDTPSPFMNFQLVEELLSVSPTLKSVLGSIPLGGKSYSVAHMIVHKTARVLVDLMTGGISKEDTVLDMGGYSTILHAIYLEQVDKTGNTVVNIFNDFNQNTTGE